MFAAFLRARLKSLGGTQFRDAHLRAAAALQERGDRLAALRHAMAVADMQLAAAVLADSMLTILDVTHAQQAKAVARAWLATFGDAARKPTPSSCSSSCSCWRHPGSGTRRLAHQGEPGSPQPRTGPGRPGARHLGGLLPQPGQRRSCAGAQQAGPPGGQCRGRAGPAVPDARGAAHPGSRSAPAGRRPAAAAAALQHGTAPLSAPIVDEFRSPVARGLGGIPAGRPDLSRSGAGPGCRGCRGTRRRGARGGTESSPTWPERGSTWSGANTSPPRPC